jgi:hypothetical protein
MHIIHTYMHTYIHTYTHTHIHTYIHTYTGRCGILRRMATAWMGQVALPSKNFWSPGMLRYLSIHTFYIYANIHTYIHTYIAVAETVWAEAWGCPWSDQEMRVS